MQFYVEFDAAGFSLFIGPRLYEGPGVCEGRATNFLKIVFNRLVIMVFLEIFYGFPASGRASGRPAGLFFELNTT